MIGLCNYSRHSEKVAFRVFQNLVDSTQKELAEMYIEVQSLHNRMGLEVDVAPVLGPAIGSHMPKDFTIRSYSKMQCNSFKHLRSPAWQDILSYREKTARFFRGVDRCRIFRSSSSLEDIPKELHFIHTRYTIPLLCYDFTSLRREMPLTEFT